MRTVGLAFEKEAPKKAKPAKGKAEKPEAKAADEQPAKGKAEKPEGAGSGPPRSSRRRSPTPRQPCAT